MLGWEAAGLGEGLISRRAAGALNGSVAVSLHIHPLSASVYGAGEPGGCVVAGAILSWGGCGEPPAGSQSQAGRAVPRARAVVGMRAAHTSCPSHTCPSPL